MSIFGNFLTRWGKETFKDKAETLEAAVKLYEAVTQSLQEEAKEKTGKKVLAGTGASEVERAEWGAFHGQLGKALFQLGLTWFAEGDKGKALAFLGRSSAALTHMAYGYDPGSKNHPDYQQIVYVVDAVKKIVKETEHGPDFDFEEELRRVNAARRKNSFMVLDLNKLDYLLRPLAPEVAARAAKYVAARPKLARSLAGQDPPIS
jgi:hypothetical protein